MGESEGLSEDRTSQLCIALTAGVVVQLGLFKRFQGTTSWSLRPGTRRALPCPCVAIPIGPPWPTHLQLRDIICHRIAVGHDADDVILPDEDVLLLPNAQVGVHEPKLAVQHLRGCGVVEVRGKGMEGTRW